MTNAERVAVTPPVHYSADEQRKPVRPLIWELPNKHWLHPNNRGEFLGDNSNQGPQITGGDPPVRFEKLNGAHGYAVNPSLTQAEIVSAQNTENHRAGRDGRVNTSHVGRSSLQESADSATEISTVAQEIAGIKYSGSGHVVNLIDELGGDSSSLREEAFVLPETIGMDESGSLVDPKFHSPLELQMVPGPVRADLSQGELLQKAGEVLVGTLATEEGMGRMVAKISGSQNDKDGQYYGGLNKAELKGLVKVKSDALSDLGMADLRGQLQESHLISKAQKTIQAVYDAVDNAHGDLDQLASDLKDKLGDMSNDIPRGNVNAFVAIVMAGVIGAQALNRKDEIVVYAKKAGKATGQAMESVGEFVDAHGNKITSSLLLLTLLAACSAPPPGSVTNPTAQPENSGEQLNQPSPEPTSINGIPTAALERVGASCTLDQLATVFGQRYGAGEYVAGAQGIGQTVPVLTGEGLEALSGFKLAETEVDAEIQTEVKDVVAEIVDAQIAGRRVIVPDFVDPEWVKQAVMAKLGLAEWNSGIEIVKYEKGMDMGHNNPLLVAPHMRPGGREIAVWDDPVVTDEARPDGSFMVDGLMMQVVGDLDGGKELWSLPGQKADGLHAEVFIYNGCNPLVVLVDADWNVIKVLAAGDLDASMMDNPDQVWVEGDPDQNGEERPVLPTPIPTNTLEPTPEMMQFPMKLPENFKDCYVAPEDLLKFADWTAQQIENSGVNIPEPSADNMVAREGTGQNRLLVFDPIGAEKPYLAGYSYCYTEADAIYPEGQVFHGTYAVSTVALSVPGNPGEVVAVPVVMMQYTNISETEFIDSLKQFPNGEVIRLAAVTEEGMQVRISQLEALNESVPDIYERIKAFVETRDPNFIKGIIFRAY